jgi:hypothetical protein
MATKKKAVYATNLKLARLKWGPELNRLAHKIRAVLAPT